MQQIQKVKSQTPKAHNEEFLAYNLAEKSPSAGPGFFSKINRTKFARKSQTDFLRTCCDIIERISQGGVQPLNQAPGEGQQDYFIYSDLFVSKTSSNADNWQIPPNECEVATSSVVNTEVRNLQQVLNSGVSDMGLINTVLVDRLGQRYIIQNLLEGMLYFNPERWGKYGSFDEGKTFKADAEIGKTMQKICDSLWLTTDNRFVAEGADEGGATVIHGSPDVKGIVAGDGRTYVMDLMRLSPRDVNFRHQEDHQSCVLRPELIKNYQVFQSWKKLYEKRRKDQKQKEEGQPKEGKIEEDTQAEDAEKEGKKEQNGDKHAESETTPEKEVARQDKAQKEEDQVQETRQDENKGEDQANDRNQDTKPEENKEEDQNQDTKPEDNTDEQSKTKQAHERMVLNPSLFTKITSQNDESRTQGDVQNLETMASYLVKEAVPRVLAELTDQVTRFTIIDCETLIQVMHKNGVNTRYLGHLHQMVCKQSPEGSHTARKGHEWVHHTVSFAILVRSVLKFIREQVVKFEHESAIEVILHCLNLLLGDEGIRRKLQEKYSPQEAAPKTDDSANEKQLNGATKQAPSPNLGKKKNKRRKKKKPKKKKESPKIESTLSGFQTSWFQLSKPPSAVKESFKNLRFEQMLQRTLEIAGKKYSFKGERLPVELVASGHNKLRFLKEVFMKLSLKLNPESRISFRVEDSMEQGSFRAPLKPADISQIGFKVKGVNHFVEEIHYNILAAEKDFKKGSISKALSSLEMCLPIVVNVYGMLHVETVKLLIRLGSFYMQLKRLDRAISLQALAFVISLKLNGPHDVNTANVLSYLSNSLFRSEQFEASLRVLKFGLKSWDLIGGPLNPVSFNCLNEIQRIALRLKDVDLLEKVLGELQNRNSLLYGKSDQRNLTWLAQLARLKATKGDFRSAVQLQTKHSFILRQLVRKYETAKPETKPGAEAEPKKKTPQMNYLQYYKMNLQKNFDESEKLKTFYKSKLIQE